MTIRQITDTLSVSPQIDEADIAAVKARGFRSIICNRPDAEQADQPDFAGIANSARQIGMNVRHIPIRGAPVAAADVDAFRLALSEMPKPILAYCRTGTRSALLWALANASDLPMRDILTLTSAAGYDLDDAISLSLAADHKTESGADPLNNRTGT